MSGFDEEPDGDPHGECAAEIARLERELAECQKNLTYCNVRRKEETSHASGVVATLHKELSECRAYASGLLQATYLIPPSVIMANLVKRLEQENAIMRRKFNRMRDIFINHA